MNAIVKPLAYPTHTPIPMQAGTRGIARDALSELVARHAALVSRLAHHLSARLPASVDIGDLVQAGSIGLIEASRSYDASQGASFETFASIRIRGAMIDELRKSDWMPRSVHRRTRDAARATREIEQRTRRAAAPSDVARALGLSRGEYGRVLEDALRGQILSLEAHVDDNGESRLAFASDDVSPTAALDDAQFRKALVDAIAALPEREALVLSLYYEQEFNLREIGATLGVSESRVCQIHGQALVRLRARLGDWIVTAR